MGQTIKEVPSYSYLIMYMETNIENINIFTYNTTFEPILYNDPSLSFTFFKSTGLFLI